MKKKNPRTLFRCIASLVVMLSLLSAVAGMLVLQKRTPASAHNIHTSSRFLMSMVHPTYRVDGYASPGKQPDCQDTTAQQRCYTPEQIRQAYDADSLYQKGITGKGYSIAIIDAFQNPDMQHDLQLFDQTYNLPDAPLHIYTPEGMPKFDQTDQTQVSWAGEITLDVEWAHAIAPDATINLIEANPSGGDSESFSDFLTHMSTATQYAIDNNLGDVISQSFGGNEACASSDALKAQHSIFEKAVAKKITLIAASGDDGSSIDSCSGNGMVQGVSSPASDPLVTAVGGTTLTAAANGDYDSEIGWSDSGGGFSPNYATPDYQSGIDGISKGRGLPDVSYNADENSGVVVVWSTSGEGADRTVVFGGTSAGSPQWAGITALLDQSIKGRFGSLNPALYKIGKSDQYSKALRDIVSGNNTYVNNDRNGGRGHKGNNGSNSPVFQSANNHGYPGGNYPYPGPGGNQPYPGPGGNSPYPGGNNPGINQPYPGGNSPYPGPGGNRPYPGPGGNNPGINGPYPGGNNPGGNQPYPGGNNPGGNRPYPGGNNPGGNNPYPGGNNPGGNNPYPGGNNPGGNSPYPGPGGNNPGSGDNSGYSAGTGWDAVTGLGTPDIANLIGMLPNQ